MTASEMFLPLDEMTSDVRASQGDQLWRDLRNFGLWLARNLRIPMPARGLMITGERFPEFAPTWMTRSRSPKATTALKRCPVAIHTPEEINAKGPGAGFINVRRSTRHSGLADVIQRVVIRMDAAIAHLPPRCCCVSR
jgi:hypothetical protein